VPGISSYAIEPVTQATDFVRTGGKVDLAGMEGFKEIPGDESIHSCLIPKN